MAAALQRLHSLAMACQPRNLLQMERCAGACRNPSCQGRLSVGSGRCGNCRCRWKRIRIHYEEVMRGFDGITGLRRVGVAGCTNLRHLLGPRTFCTESTSLHFNICSELCRTLLHPVVIQATRQIYTAMFRKTMIHKVAPTSELHQSQGWQLPSSGTGPGCTRDKTSGGKGSMS